MNELEQLYHLYYKDVFLYLRALTKDEMLSEDLTAEIFLHAYEKNDMLLFLMCKLEMR